MASGMCIFIILAAVFASEVYAPREGVSSDSSAAEVSPSESTAAGSAQQSAKTCGTKIAAVGDSITAGSSYVAQLRSLCGSSSEIKNEDGDSSTTQAMPSSSERPSADKFAFVSKLTNEMVRDFDSVLKYDCDTIIILGGTNDINNGKSSDYVTSNLDSMYSKAKAAGKRVVALTIPPLRSSATTSASQLKNLKQVNQWILTQSSADIKVDIYPLLVSSGTDDANPSYFATDLVHPNAKGKEIMAKAVFAGLTGQAQAAAGVPSGATAPPGAATATTTVTTTVSALPQTTLSQTLFDLVLNSSAGLTTILGIARQNIAIGVSKSAKAVSSTALCQPITADNTYDLDFLKKTYGRNQLEVESQLQSIKFMGNNIRVHRLIYPVFGCVENQIKLCSEYSSYDFRTIESYNWQPIDGGVEELLPTSSFGVSVNVNIEDNPNSQDNKLNTDIPDCIVAAFKRYGFKWGGDFTTVKAPSYFGFMGSPDKIIVQQQITCPAGTTLVTVPAGSSEATMSTTSTTAASASGASSSVKVSSGASSSIGNSDFSWPIAESVANWNKLISCYGPIDRGGTTGYHDGTDIGVPKGTPVLSIAAGTVAQVCSVPDVCRTCNQIQCTNFNKGDCSGGKCGSCTAEACKTCKPDPCSGFGTNVFIKHADNLYTHYVHLDKLADGITKGANVYKGQQLGVVGNTGPSQGSHLHFGFYNALPRGTTGDKSYPYTGKNALCIIPDSILTRLLPKGTNCPTLYGSSLSSINTQLVADCAKADLSGLDKLTPTAASSTSATASSASSSQSLVQVCRKNADTANAQGVVSASTTTCRYCDAGKEILKSINPSAYASCDAGKGKCCTATCPSDAVMKQNVPFISQCDSAKMGAGGDCWNSQTGLTGDRYCWTACGVATTRMALQAFNLDKSSKDLYCGGPDSIYTPAIGKQNGGSWHTKIAGVSQKMGLSNSVAKSGVDWKDITSNIKQGKLVAIVVKDKNKGFPLERCFATDGHFILLDGASDNYVIANDPGKRTACGENIVLSKSYIENAGVRYAVIG